MSMRPSIPDARTLQNPRLLPGITKKGNHRPGWGFGREGPGSMSIGLFSSVRHWCGLSGMVFEHWGLEASGCTHAMCGLPGGAR